MKKIFVFALSATVLFSCKKNDVKEHVFTGASVQLYDGKMHSYVRFDDAGVPQQLGLLVDGSAMGSLPQGDSATSGHGEEEEQSFIVPLHSKAKAVTPFDHLEVDWNPHGHEPAGIYDKPHFDFHFYMVTPGEVDAVVNGDKMDKAPADGYLPEHYISPIPGAPKMGRHWIDYTSPELDPVHPQLFTQTFVYGTYDGQVTFYEPMITLAFLKATTSFQRNVPQPARFAKAGYYPTTMRVLQSGGNTQIILENFIYHQAS